jgi:hypothetical protein
MSLTNNTTRYFEMDPIELAKELGDELKFEII